MNNKNWYDEVEESFLLNIEDNYTLNLAFGLLEERKELLRDILKLKKQLQQKEDIINKAKDLIESYYDFMDEKYDFKYFDGYKLLEILDTKGE